MLPDELDERTEVSVSGDYDLVSGQVRLSSSAARWTLVSGAMLASVFCL